MRNRGLCALAAGLAVTASAAQASSEAELIGEFGAWRAYRSQADAGVLCFAASMPVSREPQALRRGDGFVFVSYRTSEGVRDELSLVLGYPLRADADGTLTVGGASFPLMEKGEAAWLASAALHPQVVEAFRREFVASVETTSARGNATRDAYSLRGFSRAYRAMAEACK